MTDEIINTIDSRQYVTPDMIELSDGLRAAIAQMVDVNLRDIFKANFSSEPFAFFDDEGTPGKFSIGFRGDLGGEFAVSLSLCDIVDATLCTCDNLDLLEGLSAELERLAAIIREDLAE